MEVEPTLDDGSGVKAARVAALQDGAASEEGKGTPDDAAGAKAARVAALQANDVNELLVVYRSAPYFDTKLPHCSFHSYRGMIR